MQKSPQKLGTILEVFAQFRGTIWGGYFISSYGRTALSTSLMWVLKHWVFLSDFLYKCTILLGYFDGADFDPYFTTHISFFADHGGRRFWPIWYHCLWPDDAPRKRIVVTPTSGGMIGAVGLVVPTPKPCLLPYYLQTMRLKDFFVGGSTRNMSWYYRISATNPPPQPP